MNNFRFYSPTYFVFGKGTENEAGQCVKNSAEVRSLFIMEEARLSDQAFWEE